MFPLTEKKRKKISTKNIHKKSVLWIKVWKNSEGLIWENPLAPWTPRVFNSDASNAFKPALRAAPLHSALAILNLTKVCLEKNFSPKKSFKCLQTWNRTSWKKKSLKNPINAMSWRRVDSFKCIKAHVVQAHRAKITPSWAKLPPAFEGFPLIAPSLAEFETLWSCKCPGKKKKKPFTGNS